MLSLLEELGCDFIVLELEGTHGDQVAQLARLHELFPRQGQSPLLLKFQGQLQLLIGLLVLFLLDELLLAFPEGQQHLTQLLLHI